MPAPNQAIARLRAHTRPEMQQRELHKRTFRQAPACLGGVRLSRPALRSRHCHPWRCSRQLNDGQRDPSPGNPSITELARETALAGQNRDRTRTKRVDSPR